MAGLPVSNDYSSFYGDVENSVLNRQMAQQDQQMQLSKFGQEMAMKEMQAPEEVAKSQLNRLTHERDTQLMPMQTEVTQQNLGAEQKFNTYRDMLGIMKHSGIQQDEKEQMLQGALRKIQGTGMDSAKAAARTQFLLDEFRQNPQASEQRIKDAMSAYASNAKSYNAENLQTLKGTHAQELALLKAQAEAERRAAASAGPKEELPKTAEHQALKNARAATNASDRDFWLAKAFALREVPLENTGIAQGNKPVVRTEGNSVSIAPSDSARVNPTVVPPSRQPAQPPKAALTPAERAAMIKKLQGQ
jgi:hypothetical protein